MGTPPCTFRQLWDNVNWLELGFSDKSAETKLCREETFVTKNESVVLLKAAPCRMPVMTQET